MYFVEGLYFLVYAQREKTTLYKFSAGSDD